MFYKSYTFCYKGIGAMKNIKIVFLVLIFICELNSFATVSTTWISSEEIKNIKLGCQPGRQGIKRRELEDKYPWLISIDEYRKESLRIVGRILSNSDGEDIWVEFKPLLQSLAEYSEVSCFGVHQRYGAISLFCNSPFADESEISLTKADFSSRRDCLSYISRFVHAAVTEEIEVFVKWLSGAKYLPDDEDSRKKEFLKAESKDKELFYTLPLWFSSEEKDLFLKYKEACPEWKRTEEKFRFRKVYNKNLKEFRVFAFVTLRRVITDGFHSRSNEEREKIWEEFCQKAKATEDEKIAAEKAVPRITEEKKIVDKNKDVEISVEF